MAGPEDMLQVIQLPGSLLPGACTCVCVHVRMCRCALHVNVRVCACEHMCV